MADAVVRHTLQNGKPPTELHLRINGPEANFRIGTEKIRSWTLKQPTPLLLDLLDIAGAVFAADRRIIRGGDTRSGFGRDWRRVLDFRISVRCPDLWSREDVTEALRDVVAFLTDDVVTFAFDQAEADPPQSDYLDLGAPEAGPMGPGEVILFSGGLDSLAGAIETLEETADNVILVTHRSAQKMIGFQDDLVRMLECSHRGRVRYIPIRATFEAFDSRDSTQRSRSFLFAAFGFVIARLVGTSRISFFENGVVSHNLPISPQVIGTMATRTTHPLALAKLQHFLSLINGSVFPVRNPYAWRTKTEVVTSLRDHGAAGFISHTSSCNHVWMRSTERTHCGTCSQCLDRRFAILAAGLQDKEDAGSYEIDVLAGERTRPRDRTMALDWSTHAVRLAGVSEADFSDRFLGELSRIIRGFADRPASDTMLRCLDLQRRHGKAVIRVLETAARARADDIVARRLPPSSLLAMFLHEATGSPGLPDLAPGVTPAQAEMDEVGETDAGTFTMAPLRFATFHRDGTPVLEVKGLGEVRGKPATPAHGLLPQYRVDLSEGLKPDDHRYVSPHDLSPDAGSSPNAVAANVRRCRRMLAEYYLVIEGVEPDRDLLIQSARWKGYRLDPDARFVPKDDI